MRSFMKRTAPLFVLALLALGTARNAQAVGTAAGTNITNTAYLDYKVGTVDQTQQNATATVTVARKINVAITRQDGALVSVSPNQQWAYLTYTIQNTGNSPMRFALTPTALATGQALPNTGTPNTTKTTSPVNGAVYSDTAHTTAAPDTGVLATDASITVYLFVNIPVQPTVLDADVLGYKLEAKAINQSGSDFTTYASPNNLDTVAQYSASVPLDNVFADGADTDTLIHDGKASDRDGFRVNAPVLTIAKSSAPYWDPINLFASPKTIPLGIVEYVVTVENAAGAGASASSVIITDTTPGNLTFLTSTTTPAAGFGAGFCAEVSVNGGSTWTTSVADTAYSGGKLTVNLGSIAAGSVGASSVKLRYRVMIN